MFGFKVEFGQFFDIIDLVLLFYKKEVKSIQKMGGNVNVAKIQVVKEVAMRISFNLRSLFTFIVLVTVFMFATTVAMADKGSRLSDKSVVALKVDVGGAISFNVAQGSEISLIPKGDGVFVAARRLATDPHGIGKYTQLTNVIPMTRDESGRYIMIANSRPTLTLGAMAYKAGFPLRC